MLVYKRSDFIHHKFSLNYLIPQYPGKRIFICCINVNLHAITFVHTFIPLIIYYKNGQNERKNNNYLYKLHCKGEPFHRQTDRRTKSEIAINPSLDLL